jgi:tetratricopeptide (TPR) repeat protein
VNDNKTILIKTAYSYYQQGDWDRAITEYNRLLELDPSDLNVHNILADIHAKKKEISKAIQKYELVIRGYDQKMQIDKVLQVYKRMIKLVPNPSEYEKNVQFMIKKYMDHAMQLEAAEPDQALDIYRSILKGDSDYFYASIRIAKLLIKKDKKLEAIEILTNLSDSLDPKENKKMLVDIYQQILEQDGFNINIRKKLIDIFLETKDWVEAIQNQKELIEIYMSKKELANAKQLALKCIEMGDQDSFYYLGVIFYELSDFLESQNYFKKFINVHPMHLEALKYLALVCLRLNQNVEAVRTYEAIIKIYQKENRHNEIKETCQTILELDPKNELALSMHVTSSVPSSFSNVQNKPEPAAPVVRNEHVDPKQLLSEATQLVQRGLYEQAADLYLEILKHWPQQSEAKVKLQQVYVLMANINNNQDDSNVKTQDQLRKELEEEYQSKFYEYLNEHTNKIKLEYEDILKNREKEIERIKTEQEKEKAELQKKLNEQTKNSMDFEESKQKLEHEFEIKQRLLDDERKRIEKEKQGSLDELKKELEGTKFQLEQTMQQQIEQEVQLRLKHELSEANRKKEIELQIQKSNRNDQKTIELYLMDKKEKKVIQDRIMNEISAGMERLQMEKENFYRQDNRSTPIAENSLNFIRENTKIEEAFERKSEAEPRMNAAVHQSSSDHFVRQTLADIYSKQGMFLEAVKIYEQILIDNPKNDEVREKLKKILKLKGIS